MAALDPRIEAVRVQYGLQQSDFWELPQKKGTWVAKHAALEVAAAKAGIVFSMPMVLEADGTAKSAALCVSATMGDRTEWSIGEASPANNKNAYPFAMAEKRGKDRVILKLIGLNGLAYSEDEADDFKDSAPASEPKQAQPAATTNPPKREPYKDEDGQGRAYIEQQMRFISACKTQEDVQGWVESRAGELQRLRKTNLSGWNELREFKEKHIQRLIRETEAA